MKSTVLDTILMMWLFVSMTMFTRFAVLVSKWREVASREVYDPCEVQKY